jgi:hypothetical protein
MGILKPEKHFQIPLKGDSSTVLEVVARIADPTYPNFNY